MRKHLFSKRKQKNIPVYFMKCILIISITVFLPACDVVEDKVIDCVNFDKPEFNTDSLHDAVLNQAYSASIVVEIKNNPDDEYYDYEFYLKAGNLPDGLKLVQEGYEPIAFIEGTPITPGYYEFIIEIHAIDPYYYRKEYYYWNESDLCEEYNERVYSITVNTE